MDNLRSGVFWGGGGGGKKTTRKQKGLSLRRYTVFDCFNVVALSPVNGDMVC